MSIYEEIFANESLVWRALAQQSRDLYEGRGMVRAVGAPNVTDDTLRVDLASFLEHCRNHNSRRRARQVERGRAAREVSFGDEAFEGLSAKESAVLGKFRRGGDAGAGRPVGRVLDDDGGASRRVSCGNGQLDHAVEELV